MAREKISDAVLGVKDRIANICAGQIAPMFVSGAKVTVIVRHPGHDDRDVLVSNDSIDDVAAAVARAKERDAH